MIYVMNRSIRDNVSELVMTLGADLVGFADVGVLPEDVRYGLPRGISIAIAYDPDVIESIRNGPNDEYARCYAEINGKLNGISKSVEEFLLDEGYKAVGLRATSRSPVSGDFESLDEMAVALPHKTCATLAGLGWIGNTDLLITEKFGPRIRLGTILTDAPFDCDTPIIESRCGECDECAVACPVNAGREENWRRDSMERYGVKKCDAYARTISNQIGLEHQLCGICIAACPIGK